MGGEGWGAGMGDKGEKNYTTPPTPTKRVNWAIPKCENKKKKTSTIGCVLPYV